jgi:hypothetical protein
MKNATTFALIISALILTACQNSSSSRNVADNASTEKAATSTKINLEVKDPNGAPVQNNQPSAPIVTNKVGIVVTEKGLIPDSISTTIGKELMIFNSLDKQVDLYTTVDGNEPCAELGATIEIPGGQTKLFPLEKAFTCTVINQQNTEQKTALTVQ